MPGAAGEAPLAAAVPVPATPLLGREQEAAAVEELVTREGVRLVTLTGPGGVGKTRLMVEAARQLGPGFADGARFVELASVSAADLVAAAIAAGLGLSTSAGPLIADLQSYLRPRRLLLALDNFEQVMGPLRCWPSCWRPLPAWWCWSPAGRCCGSAASTSSRCPRCRFRPPGRAADPAHLQRYASVSLFAERAHAVAPGFELTGGNAGGGGRDLPPAGRAAAGHRAGRGPGPAAAPAGAGLPRLDQQVQPADRAGPATCPSGSAPCATPWTGATACCRPASRRCSPGWACSPGPFSLPAAEAVCAYSPGEDQGPGPGQVMETLGSLVESSLVRAETRGDEPRFSLLETIRDYALERLA